MVVPAVIGILWMATLYVRQAVRDIPVPTKPLDGDVVAADVLDLLWSEGQGDRVGAHVQVALDRRFEKIIFEERCDSCFNLRRNAVLVPGGTYYWRVQRVRDGKASPWTKPIEFRVAE